MNIFNRVLNRNKIVWYSDIPSADKFISSRRFNLTEVNHTIDLLHISDDEICIQLPTDFKYRVQLSIWGESSSVCTLERVEPEKCSSYWLTTTKEKVKNLLRDIQGLADTPSKFGLILKEWE